MGNKLWSSQDQEWDEAEAKKLFDINKMSLHKYSAVFDYMFVHEHQKLSKKMDSFLI